MLAAPQTHRFQRALVEWFARHGHDYPWRRTRDPYAILVSEVMLQQTTIAMVLRERHFQRWMSAFPNIAALAAAAESEVLRHWEGLGYYNRARNLQRAAAAIVERHNGEFPNSPGAIRALPGVGPYTAGAVISLAFDRPAAIVDGNVARVLARLFDFQTPVESRAGRDQLWAWAAALVPRRDARRYNSALMELGQRICLVNRPACGACPVRSWCRATEPERLPVKSPRRASVRVDEDVLMARRGACILLEQECGRRRRGLWKLPAINGRATAGQLLETRYTITHHRVTLRVFAARGPVRARANESWIARPLLETIGMPSPYRRALAAVIDEPPKGPRARPRKSQREAPPPRASIR